MLDIKNQLINLKKSFLRKNPEEYQVNLINLYSLIEKLGNEALIRKYIHIMSSKLNLPENLMQQGFNVKRSGDVLVNYLPAYMDHETTGTTHGSPYSYDTHVPLLFYGWNIKHGSSSERVYITDISATLAMMLNIQFPNGCTGKPISFLVK